MSPFHILGVSQPPGKVDEVAKVHAADCNASAEAPLLGEGAADPSYSYEVPMSDSPTVVATPYPTYMQGGNDDDSFRAALTAHGQSSIERNQDSQFAALRSQIVHRDVESSKLEAEKSSRAHERETSRQFAEVKAELATLRCEGLAREVATLRDARQNDALTQILQLLKK